MSRVLQPHPEGGFSWALAFTLSAALHAGAAVYLLELIPFGAPEAAPPVSAPVIAISNTVLEGGELDLVETEEDALTSNEDTETLDEVDDQELAQTEAEELAQAEAEDIEQAEAETLTPADEQETLSAEADTEELAQAEADALEAVEEDTALAPTEVEDALQAAEPDDVLAAVPSEPEALAPVESDAVTAPDQVSPILTDIPDAEPVTTASAAPALAPIPLDDGTSLQGATMQSVVPQTVTAAPVIASAVQPVARVAPSVSALRPATPPPPTRTVAAPPPRSPEDLAVLELIQRIRNRFGDVCLIALPQNQGAGLNPLVTLISDQERSMATFVSEVLSDPDLPVDERRILIDPRQCAALDYARAHRNYPAFRVNLTLQSRVVASGNNLVGQLSGFGGRYTSLLAVDSNGVVSDLRRFTQFRQGSAQLDAPVTINGAPRDTSHLLIAVATQGLTTTVSERSGQLAQDFFPPLREETTGQSVLGILPFDVR